MTGFATNIDLVERCEMRRGVLRLEKMFRHALAARGHVFAGLSPDRRVP